MLDPIPVLIVLGVLTLVAAVLAWHYWSEAARRRRLAEEAESLGLEFRENASSILEHRFEGFRLFSRGRSRKITNLIAGDSGDVELCIFDYQFVTGSGKNRNTQRQSVIALRSPHLACPYFSLRPQRWIDRLGAMIGLQDIDFASHETFSSQFVLQGSDEDAIRDFFSDSRLEALEGFPGISFEACGDELFFYRPGKRRKPEAIKAALAEAYEIYHLLGEPTAGPDSEHG